VDVSSSSAGHIGLGSPESYREFDLEDSSIEFDAVDREVITALDEGDDGRRGVPDCSPLVK
jgi:hypothetical protein